jgi:NADH-quinone oxidoreductase subunit G
VLLGNAAVQHPEFALIHAAAQFIADTTGATLGFLTEAGNTVGAHLVDALPGQDGLNAAQAFTDPRKAYLLMNVEAEFDTANPQQALAALNRAEMVISLSAFKHGAEYADVMLPIAPFTETSGTFINAEGTVQSFNGVVRPLGDTRPAWKVLRVLGNLLGLPGFEFDTSEQVRDAALGKLDIASKLSNVSAVTPALGKAVNGNATPGSFERLADVPIYHADALARRAESLQLTHAAKVAVRASLPGELFERLGLGNGDAVRIRQGDLSVTLPAVLDNNLPANVVRVPAATSASAQLGGMFGELVVEKA